MTCHATLPDARLRDPVGRLDGGPVADVLEREEWGAGQPFPLLLDSDKRAMRRLAPQFARVIEGGRSACITEAGRAAVARAWGAW